MKPFKIIYYLFFAFIAVIALLLIVSAFPIEGNLQVKTVLSGSMEPAIGVGSIIVIKPANEYRIGDVIAFQFAEEETPITHRIYDLKVTEGIISFITKGDANEEPDNRGVFEREIIGRVLFDVPFVGYAVNAAQTPIGFMLIIVVPATIIIYDEVKKVKDEIIRLKNQKKKKDEEQDEVIEKSEEKDIEQDKGIKELKQEIEELKNKKDSSP